MPEGELESPWTLRDYVGLVISLHDREYAAVECPAHNHRLVMGAELAGTPLAPVLPLFPPILAVPVFALGPRRTHQAADLLHDDVFEVFTFNARRPFGTVLLLLFLLGAGRGEVLLRVFSYSSPSLY